MGGAGWGPAGGLALGWRFPGLGGAASGFWVRGRLGSSAPHPEGAGGRAARLAARKARKGQRGDEWGEGVAF
jgi:hypothetical protein